MGMQRGGKEVTALEQRVIIRYNCMKERKRNFRLINVRKKNVYSERNTSCRVTMKRFYYK
jgi:hypothetical protein